MVRKSITLPNTVLGVMWDHESSLIDQLGVQVKELSALNTKQVEDPIYINCLLAHDWLDRKHIHSSLN